MKNMLFFMNFYLLDYIRQVLEKIVLFFVFIFIMPVANSSQKLLYLEKNSSSVFAVRLKVKVIFRSSILGLEDRTRLPFSNRDLFSMNSFKGDGVIK